MKLNKMTKLSYGVKVAFACGALSLTAQNALAQEESAEDVETIQITGIRGSQKANINAKRFSNAIVDAINAEDIGKFPDKNVAESLSRIPGITIDRDFGEGQGVTIRGIQPDRNLTLLNGQAVGTAQWFVLDNAGRNFNFEMLASEMVGGLEVYKSAQADIDEGANGGTVILRTRKPLDLDANTLQGSIETQYNDLSEENDPGLSGLYSWKNDDETFGLLVSASLQERTVRRETNEDFGWFGPSIERIDPLIEAPQGASEKGAVPWGMGSALFQQDRERVGFDVTAQWAPNDNLDVTLHYLSSTLKADNVNSNLIGIPFRGIAYMGTDTNPGTVTNNIVDSLQVSGVPARPGWSRFLAYDNIYREGSEMSTEVLDLDVNYELENGLLHFQLGTTTGEGTNNDFFTEFWADPNDARVAFDFTNPGGTAPAIDFVGPSPWLQTPSDELWLGGIFDQRNLSEDEENYVQVDYTREVDLGVVTSVKSGLKIRDRSFKQDRYRTDLANLAPVGEGSLGPASQFWSGDLFNVSHANTSGIAGSYFAPDRSAMYNALYAVPECSASSAEGALCRRTDVFQTASSYEVSEDIVALYSMANFEGEGFRGNFGVRYVTTDQDSGGYDLVTGAPVSFSGDYSAWLPSVNLSYDLADDLVFRAAAGKTLARPSPFQMSASFNITPETSSGNAGNPELKPERSANYEMGLEWYYNDSSLAAVTAFTKDLTDVIVTQTVSATVDGNVINFLSQPVNAGSGSIDGIEFQVQHAFDNGFGGYFNYTYSDASEIVAGATTFRVPFVSKNSYNFGAYYENDVYSARVNYTYRSEYYRSSAEIGDQYRDEQTQVDAQFTYNVTDMITLKLEGLNLTDEIWENYYVRNSDGARLGGTQSANGRRYYVGASFKF